MKARAGEAVRLAGRSVGTRVGGPPAGYFAAMLSSVGQGRRSAGTSYGS
jgi:hypothetical protein